MTIKELNAMLDEVKPSDEQIKREQVRKLAMEITKSGVDVEEMLEVMSQITEPLMRLYDKNVKFLMGLYFKEE